MIKVGVDAVDYGWRFIGGFPFLDFIGVVDVAGGLHEVVQGFLHFLYLLYTFHIILYQLSSPIICWISFMVGRSFGSLFSILSIICLICGNLANISKSVLISFNWIFYSILLGELSLKWRSKGNSFVHIWKRVTPTLHKSHLYGYGFFSSDRI